MDLLLGMSIYSVLIDIYLFIEKALLKFMKSCFKINAEIKKYGNIEIIEGKGLAKFDVEDPVVIRVKAIKA